MNHQLASQKSDIESRNLARVQAAIDAWRAGTGSIFDLLDANVRWEVAGNAIVAGVYTSKAELEKKVLQPFGARFSVALTPVVRHLYADGDTVIAFFEASGTALDGKPYSNTFAWFLHMDDNVVVRAEVLLDSVAFNDLWTRVTP
jgi:ketosteroid isomerase-like protein